MPLFRKRDRDRETSPGAGREPDRSPPGAPDPRFDELLAALHGPRENDVVYHTPGEGIRTQAAVALGSLRDPRALDLLVAVVQDESESLYVRIAAAEGLGLLGDPRAIRPLLTAKAGFPLVMGPGLETFQLADALQRLAPTEDGIRELVAALDDDEFRVRLEAELLLKHHAGPEGERAFDDHQARQG